MDAATSRPSATGAETSHYSASLLETLLPRLIYHWIERHVVPHGDAFFLVLTLALMLLLYRHL